MPGPYGSGNFGNRTRWDPCGQYGLDMRPERKETRLRGYDYARLGLYFVTICCHERAPVFGIVRDGRMRPNDLGGIVSRCWKAIPEHHGGVALDEFVLMPDHVHGLLALGFDTAGGRATSSRRAAAAPHPVLPRLGTVVGAFKSAAGRLVNLHRGTPGPAVWQRGYHEHIVRNEDDLRRIREYIAMNPSMSHAPNP